MFYLTSESGELNNFHLIPSKHVFKTLFNFINFNYYR